MPVLRGGHVVRSPEISEVGVGVNGGSRCFWSIFLSPRNQSRAKNPELKHLHLFGVQTKNNLIPHLPK